MMRLWYAQAYSTVISDYRPRVHRDPERGRWPTSAVAIVVLSFALVSVVVLSATGRRLWGGQLDPNSLGSLGEWASGFGIALAVYLAYRQFSAEQTATREAEYRAEALRVAAWVTWSDVPVDGVSPARAVNRLLAGR
jgi:hypothetical protein